MSIADLIDVPVVDAHHHLAKLDLGYPWLSADAPTDRYHGNDRQLRRDYLIAQYRADAAAVPLAASVHIENGASDPLREARWIGGVIAEHTPVPAAHVARADLGAKDASRTLEELAEMQHVRGVRHTLNWHPNALVSHTPRPGIINETEWRRGFALLSEWGLSFDLQVFAEQLGDAVLLARDHPETRIILDHLGMPRERDRDYLRAWEQGLRRLARCDNVTVKISAIGTTDHHWSLGSIAPIVNKTIEAFGPARVMFGSNFPVDGMYSSFEHLYSAFAAIASSYTRDERADMFGRTAARVYRLAVPGL